jgi:hypothetical protein
MLIAYTSNAGKVPGSITIMKQIVLARLAALVLGCGLSLAHSGSAQVLAQDNAAQTVYTNGWSSGTNGGTGFGPWVLTNTPNVAGSDFSGFFLGDCGVAAVNSTNNRSFGIYANGATTDDAVAYRTLSNSLTVGTVFSLKFKNDDLAANGVMGFSLGNSASFGPSTDFATLTGNARFSFYFVGGSADYTIYDGNTTSDSGVGFTRGGLTIEFALRSATTYRVTIKNADGSIILTNYDNQPLQGSGVIDSFACYNLQTGGGQNAYFNQFSVVPVSLVPPVIQNVSPTNGAFYLPTSQTITFNAASAFSGIKTNNVTVTLNGTNVTSLGFTGSATNWAVVAAPVLVPNFLYNAVISVTDTNGNRVTNAFTFNTWTANNLFIEAEAYNYSSGHFNPAPILGAYDSIVAPGSNNVDYLEYGDPTNATFGVINPYRPADPIWFEPSGDTADHAGYQGAGETNWAMGFIQNGEWENYTRRVTNGAYAVYARMSGGGTPSMLMERDASPTATSTNQPRASLGTFVGWDTHSVPSNFVFVPLQDFFSSNVVVRFSTNAPTTNTFRLSNIGADDSYNLDYLIFVPVAVANTNTLRPYISSGYPYPNATGVLPDQAIQFTIANRDSTVNPAGVRLLVNGADVTASLTLSNNTAGTVVTYQPSTLYPVNTNSTVTAIFADTAGVSQTNTWQFAVANVLVIPSAYALTSGSGVGSGFNVHLVKYPDSWPAAYQPAPLSSAWAEAMLAGGIVNTNTSTAATPDVNVTYVETNTINYELCGTNSPDGYTFSNEVAYPNVPLASYSPCANTNGPGNFALSAVMYVQLSAGLYQWAVRSDDGFRLATGTGAVPTNTLIMDYEGARGAGAPSVFTFIIQTSGVYPMRLLYYQGGFGASVELYSINRLTGVPALINDPANPGSIKVYRSSSASGLLTLLNPAHSGTTTTFNFQTQSGKTHTVQYKTALTNAVWQTLKVVAGNGAVTNITDTTATNTARFYRVSTQ